MADLVHFETSFRTNTPCLYFNVMSTQLPVHVVRRPVYARSEEMGRITIYDTPHWMVLRLIARYLKALFDDIGLHGSVTSPHMSSFDIETFLTDPAKLLWDTNAPYMANCKIPEQIAIVGTYGIMTFLEYEIVGFLTRQLLGKSYGYLENNHIYIKGINYLVPFNKPTTEDCRIDVDR